MKAIVPAAGIGKRLRPHTATTPKVLLNVAGKPIVSHIVDALIDAGVDETVVVVGEEAGRVERYLRDNYTYPFHFVVQRERRGLGHAVYMGLDDSSEPAVVVLGDTILEVDYEELFSQTQTSIGVKEVDDPAGFGVVETDGDAVKLLVEKPEHPGSKLAITGIYYIENQRMLRESVEELINNNVTTKDEYQLTDALQLLVERGIPVKTFPVKHWYDCGHPDSLLETNRVLLDKSAPDPPEDSPGVIPPVAIGDGVQIINSIVGPYATIDKDSMIRDSIVKDSIIGRSAFLENCNITHSIVGESAAIRGRQQELNVGDYSEIRL